MDQDTLKIMLKNYGLKLYNESDIIEYSSPVTCINQEGYIVRARLSNLKSGTSPRFFHPSNPFTLINIQNWCKLNGVPENIHVNFKQTYKNAIEPMIFICSIHGEFKKPLCDFKKYPTCYFCTNTANVVWEGNSIEIQRPDLIKYFKDKEDIKLYPMYSSKIVNLICDKCGTEKEIPVRQLTINGFSCDNCSDNISIPEKFARGILSQLQMEYMTQKTFNWSKNKRYDFYLNNQNIIIETHGLQHYEEIKRGKSLEKEQENDKLKYNLALENGIKKYIIVDCRYSNFEWLKEKFINSLNSYFDMSKIDWQDVYNYSMKNYMLEACKLYNDGFKLLDICKLLKISETSIRNYLKIGTNLKLCNYDSREIMHKVGKLKGIKVDQYDLDNNYIATYESMCEATRKINVSQSKISLCVYNKRKTAGGFKWKIHPLQNNLC